MLTGLPARKTLYQFALLALASCLPFLAQAQLVCDPANNVVVGNDIINLAGTEYDAILDQTTFYYCITSGSAPSISHLTFTCGGCDQNDLPFCANNSDCGSDLFSGSGVVDFGTWVSDGSGGAIISSGVDRHLRVAMEEQLQVPTVDTVA